MVVLVEPDAFYTTKAPMVVITDSNTPTVIYTHAMPEDKVLYISAFAVVINDLDNKAAGGAREAAFGRARGNILKFDESAVESKITNFSGAQPSLSFDRNNTDKTVEMTIVGRAGESLRWHIEITAKETR